MYLRKRRVLSLAALAGETGPVETEFLRSSARYLAAGRGVSIALISLFGVFAAPAGSAGLAMGLFGLSLLAGAVENVGWRARYLALGLVLGRAAAIIATQSHTLPGPEGAGTNEWAVNALTITTSTLFWEWTPAVAVPASAALLGLNLLTDGGAGGWPLVVRVALECALARLSYLLVRRGAREIDRLRREQELLRRQATLALALRQEQREQLALLHDTAASTLQLAARREPPADPDELAGYARRDLAMLTAAPTPATSGTVAPGCAEPVDLTSALRSLAEQSPLSIDLQVDRAPQLPPGPTVALVRAVREALHNVDRHAGVNQARLRVEGRAASLTVEISDDGVGFDPLAVPKHSRGLSGSIAERMAAAGGRALITSQPGAGTRVRLEWPHD